MTLTDLDELIELVRQMLAAREKPVVETVTDGRIICDINPLRDAIAVLDAWLRDYDARKEGKETGE